MREWDATTPALWLSNLPWHIGPGELRMYLGDTLGWEAVKHIRLATDKNTGLTRGHALLILRPTVNLEAAVSLLDGARLDGRRLRCERAVLGMHNGERRRAPRLERGE